MHQDFLDGDKIVARQPLEPLRFKPATGRSPQPNRAAKSRFNFGDTFRIGASIIALCELPYTFVRADRGIALYRQRRAELLAEAARARAS